MTIQSGKNTLVGYKIQAGLGTPASGAGATGLRFTPSSGLSLQKQIIQSAEVRRDAQKTRGRHGTKSVGGNYTGELSTGSTWDSLLEAALRSTFTAALAITAASHTSVTTTATTIVALAGSWLTDGVRIGDMIKGAAMHTPANSGIWYRIINVTATTLTIAGVAPLILDATADSTATFTVAKTLVSGATPTERYWTFEEYGQDIDASEIYSDCKITKIEINAQPNAPVIVTITVMGLAGVSASGASAPTFTPTPTFTATLPLVMSDGIIRINGVDYNVLTGFSLVYDSGGQATPVLAPNAPDVFLSNAALSGSFSIMRQDMTLFDAFNNETQIDLFAVMSENTANPKAFVSFYVGNATLSGDSGNLGADGAYTETVPWAAGIDTAGGARALTTLKIATG